MTVFRMIRTGEVPNIRYLSKRGVVRKKYEGIIERLAPLARVKSIVISAGPQLEDTIYSADGGRWLKAIDMIDELARMAAERHSA